MVPPTVQTRWPAGADTFPWPERQAITGVVIHRIQVTCEDASYSDTPAEVIRFLPEHSIGVDATGGTMPHHVGAGHVASRQ